MIISAKKTLELNQRYKLIEKLSERELDPEGVGIDVRVGEVYEMVGESYLGIDKRKTAEIRKIADIEQGDQKVTIKPGCVVLIKTIESVNVPSEKIVVEEGKEPVFLMLDVYPRSTLQRCGMYFMGTKTDPGYFGELTFALANVGNSAFELELGARVANLVFKEVTGDISRPYEGQWRGGRVAAQELEEQK